MSETFRNSSWDRHGVIAGILSSVTIPKFAKIQQVFEDNTLKDIPAAIDREFARPEIAGTIKSGMSVAITVGSRGIANIALIARETVRNVKKLGGKPFIFPAMGSHGGATAEGQRKMIEGFGVTEQYVGCPIKSSMETVVIGRTPAGKPVYLDKNAGEADGILVLARVKPHTAYRGPFESGLYKMMVIGMGKQKGAESCHDEGFVRMAENIPLYGDIIMAKVKILFGLAIIENAFDNTAKLIAVPKNEIRTREPGLLEEAKRQMPKILFPKFDILIVDQIGKNFSGDGADPNISGTYCTPYASGGPEFQRYIILDLSDETHGNGLGLGLADLTTKRAFDKADFDAAYPNALTSTVLIGAKVPMVMQSDKLAMSAAIFSAVNIDKARPRIVRIPNTSHVDRIWISEAMLEEARKHPQIKLLEEPKVLPFDKDGNLALGH
jgi:hypothetical protein